LRNVLNIGASLAHHAKNKSAQPFGCALTVVLIFSGGYF
jgi:hypothetical protein